MNEQPLATLLKTFPYMRYHPEWQLVTWHPRGLFDDAFADKLIDVIGWEERCRGGAVSPLCRFQQANAYSILHAFRLPGSFPRQNAK
jgi:hypothetical protein